MDHFECSRLFFFLISNVDCYMWYQSITSIYMGIGPWPLANVPNLKEQQGRHYLSCGEYEKLFPCQGIHGKFEPVFFSRDINSFARLP